MHRRTRIAAVVSACALLIPVAPVATPPAYAGEKGVIVQDEKERIVAQLRTAVKADPAAFQRLRERLNTDGKADLVTLLAGLPSPAATEFTRKAIAADIAVKRGKGLEQVPGPLLQARWVEPPHTKYSSAYGQPPLFAATPRSDAATTLDALTLDGEKRQLDLASAPQQPLVLVELDLTAVLPATAMALSATLAARGLSGTASAAVHRPKSATRLDSIHVKNDKESWILGPAETYGMAIGRGVDGAMRIDFVDMAYLTTDATTYSPGQQVINWQNFSWGKVDVVILERDDSTDCTDLADALADAVAPYANASSHVRTVGAVLAALDDKSASIDDDYVDSFSSVPWGVSAERRGDSGNAQAALIAGPPLH